VAGQILGGPVGCQREEAGEVVLGFGEEAPEAGNSIIGLSLCSASTVSAASALDAAAGDRAGQDLHAGVPVPAEPDRRADQRADRVGGERAADRQHLWGSSPPTTRRRWPSTGTGMGSWAEPRRVCASPGGLDRTLDLARWDKAGHPQPDRHPASEKVYSSAVLVLDTLPLTHNGNSTGPLCPHRTSRR
jgi:hypothetical protein